MADEVKMQFVVAGKYRVDPMPTPLAFAVLLLWVFSPIFTLVFGVWVGLKF